LTSPPVEISRQAQVAGAAVAQSERAGMEEQLLQKIDITSDDFRQLMQNRANQVEAYLLKSGRVTADRLFITAPKPVNAGFIGEDRANLTLD
jgi:predicted acetyltransferase